MKTYNKPEVNITYYATEDSIMLTSGVSQDSEAIKSVEFSSIDF
jgi:hypothetical protein